MPDDPPHYLPSLFAFSSSTRLSHLFLSRYFPTHPLPACTTRDSSCLAVDARRKAPGLRHQISRYPVTLLRVTTPGPLCTRFAVGCSTTVTEKLGLNAHSPTRRYCTMCSPFRPQLHDHDHGRARFGHPSRPSTRCLGVSAFSSASTSQVPGDPYQRLFMRMRSSNHTERSSIIVPCLIAGPDSKCQFAES